MLNRFRLRNEVSAVELAVLKPWEDPLATTRDAPAHIKLLPLLAYNYFPCPLQNTSPARYPVKIKWANYTWQP